MRYLKSLLTNARDWWQGASNRSRTLALAVLALLAVICALPFMGEDETDNDIVVDAAQTQSQEIEYIVQPGDSIISTIAPKHNVPWEAIAVVNESELARVNAERCAKLSERYTDNRSRRGHYCNKTVVVGGKPMVDLNSLQPGDKLRIPLTRHPVVDQVIAAIPGRSIAIVIDDTGSMGNDLAQVSAWYMRASHELGKDIVTVVLYADGNVRQFKSTGEVTFAVTGDFENTRNGLEVAAAAKPDAIVLVSDEPGDDWNGFKDLKLPPVYTHSLDTTSHENLRHVATVTGGQFMRPPLDAVVARN